MIPRVRLREAGAPPRVQAWGCARAPFAPLWLAWTATDAVCALAFGGPGPAGVPRCDREAQARVEAWLAGSVATVEVHARPFTLRVWRALLAVPPGSTIGYGALAARAGAPRAARAVGQAMARNPVAWLIPCHRVCAADGPGGYTWGTALKQALLDWERRGAVLSPAAARPA